MKSLVIAVAWVLFASPAAANGYSMVGSAWVCQGEGEIEAAESGRATDNAISKAQCLPQFSDGPTNVIAFQGRYAFVCERLKGEINHAFYCYYALTRDIRDSRGVRVPDHFSKESPSPHFFDGP